MKKLSDYIYGLVFFVILIIAGVILGIISLISDTVIIKWICGILSAILIVFSIYSLIIDPIILKRKNKKVTKMKLELKTAFDSYLNNFTPEKRSIIFNKQRPEQADYGYCPENPICVGSRDSRTDYLSKLRDSKTGKPFAWLREGSVNLQECNNAKDVIVDKFQLYLDFEPFKEIYICIYAYNTSYTPKDMYLEDKEQKRPYDGDILKISTEFGIPPELYIKNMQGELKVREYLNSLKNESEK